MRVVVRRDLLLMQEVGRVRHLENVLRSLGLGAGRLDRDELLMVVSRIAADPSLWRPVVRHDPARVYVPNSKSNTVDG